MSSASSILKDPVTATSAAEDPKKLENIQATLSSLKKVLVDKDIQIISSQKQKIAKFEQNINKLKEKVKKFKQESVSNILTINNEVGQLQGKISKYELSVKQNNKEQEYQKQIDQLQKQYLKLWQKRISLSNMVNVGKFMQIELEDRKSKANEVFKWIIVAIYGQPESKYYWPNFKEQIFQRDQGVDFKARLGKINASTAKQQQRVKTDDILVAFKQIQRCEQLKPISSQLGNLRQIIQIYQRCYQLAKKIQDLQKSIEKSKQQSIEKDQEAMRWKARVGALNDRIITNNQYSATLDQISKKLSGKGESYNTKQKQSAELIEKMKNFQGVIDLATNLGQQQRQNCECNIF